MSRASDAKRNLSDGARGCCEATPRCEVDICARLSKLIFWFALKGEQHFELDSAYGVRGTGAPAAGTGAAGIGVAGAGDGAIVGGGSDSALKLGGGGRPSSPRIAGSAASAIAA